MIKQEITYHKGTDIEKTYTEYVNGEPILYEEYNIYGLTTYKLEIRYDINENIIPNSWTESIFNHMGLNINYINEKGKWDLTIYDEYGRDTYFTNSVGDICTWEYNEHDEVISRDEYNHITNTTPKLVHAHSPTSSFEYIKLNEKMNW